ncbi:MAG: serine/threonine-protein kinase PknD [Parachlamydiaceae bacterium]|nr:serine/threonine-protein kinase PknD [Parachlamydiaceae bacterium]
MSNEEPTDDVIAYIQEHKPTPEQIRFSIGPYQVLDSIGKGGMGEVFLAYDTTCGRRIALKSIRSDLVDRKKLQVRFLKEARITSQLTHPAIIPIFAIEKEEDIAYYTMPFVEGKTLRELLVTARQQEKQGLKQDHMSTIPALTRIYLSICQAIAYAHSKQVIHRDIKPNNIIIGRYGEVLILDWGLAKMITQTVDDPADDPLLDLLEEPDPSQISQSYEETRTGKVVGTVAYLSPERALGHPATFQSDIYSLGVILYQILTLHHPFHRKSLREFRKNVAKEVLFDPAEVAPYRDVPPELSRIALKCLAFSVEGRYLAVDDLVRDIEGYLEGRSEWFQSAELDINGKSDWEFQENVLLADHMIINREVDASDWVLMMVSKASFSGNTKIEASIRIDDEGNGIGFLLSIPEAAEREHPNNGYCLWIASDQEKTTKLLRGTVEVMNAPEVFLLRHIWYQVRIEKIENNIHFYLNDILQFSYISHLPLSGTHIGVLSRDGNFSLRDFRVSVGSQNITVNCLAIPDAFLAHKNYATALSEYRRIGYAFPGTAEAREALFRAGVTLLEEARDCIDLEQRYIKSEEALEEFDKLRGTPGAPLEYLGKALVYEALDDYEEEAKCFELAHRRYPHHPLLPVLQEQLIYRMYDSSRYHRRITYEFILLALRYLPATTSEHNIRRLYAGFKKSWETLPFLIEQTHSGSIQSPSFAISLAFWLAKPYILEEMIDNWITRSEKPLEAIINACFALLVLGHHGIVQEKLESLKEFAETPSMQLLQLALNCHTSPLEEFQKALLQHLPEKKISAEELRVVLHLLEQAIQQQLPKVVLSLCKQLKTHTLSPPQTLQIDCYYIWALLLMKDWDRAGRRLNSYSSDLLMRESSLLYFLYGCWLYATGKKEEADSHFSSYMEVPYPFSWMLFKHFQNKEVQEQEQWLERAFVWEKTQLYRQLALYYHCLGDSVQAENYRIKEKQLE